MISIQRNTLLLAISTLLLTACNLPFLNDEEAKIEAKREAEGKAIGSGCRYSGRPLEECYGLNPKTSKAAMFAGWRDMDGYMRENNIQTASPEPETPAEKPKAADASAAPSTEKAASATAGAEKAKTAEATAAEEKAKAEEAAKDALGKAGARNRKQPRRVA